MGFVLSVTIRSSMSITHHLHILTSTSLNFLGKKDTDFLLIFLYWTLSKFVMLVAIWNSTSLAHVTVKCGTSLAHVTVKCGTALAHVTEMWNITGSCDCGTTLAHVTVKCGTALVHVTVKCGTAMKAPFLFFVSKCSVGQSLMFISFLNRIGGVMVSVLASSVVDLGIEPRLSQTKDYQIGFCCISAKHTALRREQRLVGSESG